MYVVDFPTVEYFQVMSLVERSIKGAINKYRDLHKLHNGQGAENRSLTHLEDNLRKFRKDYMSTEEGRVASEMYSALAPTIRVTAGEEWTADVTMRISVEYVEGDIHIACPMDIIVTQTNVTKRKMYAHPLEITANAGCVFHDRGHNEEYDGTTHFSDGYNTWINALVDEINDVIHILCKVIDGTHIDPIENVRRAYENPKPYFC